jgi:hypothetical protein
MQKVTELIEAAFTQAFISHREIHAAWTSASHRIGGLLPSSLLMSSIQQAGRLDLLLRCLEDELGADISDEKGSDVSHQSMFSDLWVCQVYEFFRLLQQRKLMPKNDEFKSLFHQLTLLRITLDKHEIAKEKKLAAPLKMKRYPPRDDDSDIYEYSKDDPKRGHIMPGGISRRGSMMWGVIDITSGGTFWTERRELSEKILELFRSTPPALDPVGSPH